MMRALLLAMGAISIAQLPAATSFLFERQDHLPLGEERTGLLDITDRMVEETGHVYDSWFFDAEPGDEITLDLRSDDFDTYLVLMHPDGTRFQNDDTMGDLNSRLSQRLRTSGRHTVLVRGYEEDARGSYTLSLSEGMTPGPQDLTEVRPPKRILLGSEVPGRLEEGDSSYGSGKWVDIYTFDAEPGHMISAQMQSFDVDSHLTLITPRGREIINDDIEPGIFDAGIEHLTTERGSYRLLLTTFNPGETGGYRLSLEDKTQRLALNEPLQLSVDGTAHVLLSDDLRDRPTLTLTLEGEEGHDLDLRVITLNEITGEWLNVAESRSLSAIESLRFAPNSDGPIVINVIAADGEISGATLRETGDSHADTRMSPPRGTHESHTEQHTLKEPHLFSMPMFGTPPSYLVATIKSKDRAATVSLGSSQTRLHAGSDGFVMGDGVLSWGVISVIPTVGPLPAEVDCQLDLAWVPEGELLHTGQTIVGTVNNIPAAHPIEHDGGPLVIRLEPNGHLESEMALRLVDLESGQTIFRTDGETHDFETVLVCPEPDQRILALIEPTQVSVTPHYRLTAEVPDLDDVGIVNQEPMGFDQGPDSSQIRRFTAPIAGFYQVGVLPEYGSGDVSLRLVRQGQPDLMASEGEPELAVLLDADETIWLQAQGHSSQGVQKSNLSIEFLGEGSIADATPEPETWGVFIGIADYEGYDLELPLCDEDALRLRDRLAEQDFLEIENTVLLTNFSATRAAIDESLRLMLDRVGPEDRFIFFYSGHGAQLAWGSDPTEPDQMAECICPWDTMSDNRDLTDEEFAAILDRIPARLSMVFLDSCNAGGFQDEVARRPGRLGLYASEEDLVSVPYVEQKAGGILAHTLLVGFEGSADLNCDGKITAGELSDFTLTKMPAIFISDSDHSGRLAQHPESSRTVPYETVLLELNPPQ